jgi:peptidoglycan/LPS O-acetylase OafA/YrhL
MLAAMGSERATTESFADAMARGDGGRFDQMRLAAAMLVVVSHAFEISEGTRANEPFLRFSREFTFGEIAVLVFFALSGYLLAHSFRRDGSVLRFAARRARRILPGLVVCVVLLAFVIGPLLTALPFTDYFGAGETWAFLANIVFAPDLRALPGVFEAAPNGPAVNAPLWTLHYEVVSYGLLAALVASGRFGPRGAAMLLAAAALLHPLTEGVASPPLAHYLRPLSLLAPVFFAGVILAILDAKIPRNAWLALAGFGLFLAASALGRPAFGFLVGGVYAVLYVATSRPSGAFRRVTRGADLSYGVYLYGWPIQQILVTTGAAVSVGANMVFGLAGAACAGAASWFLVERRFLRRAGLSHGDAIPGLVKFLQNPPAAAASAFKSPD